MIWDFFQNQILGMHWLSELFRLVLARAGVDVAGRAGGSLHFFLYDTVKISILLCVLIFSISYIQSYFPPERCRRMLGRLGGVQGCAAAALLGTVTPFCSCSSIPIFIGFSRAGMPLGVNFSFLISSPMVDLGSLVILTSVFGARLALIYVVLGLCIAVAGGMLIGGLGLQDQVSETIAGGAGVHAEGDLFEMSAKERIGYARTQTAFTFRKVFPYILAGVSIGAIIHNWIPGELIVSLLGTGGVFSVFAAVLAGIPVYADIFGTIPIAEALIAKGAQAGTVLSFMMAVTTLSLPSLLMLSKVVRPKLLWTFIAVCTAGIVLVGLIFNSMESFV